MPTYDYTDQELKIEIAKVARRLPRWVHKPQQINVKILVCHLELVAGGAQVNEEMLKLKCLDKDLSAKQFDTNFAQMKNIAKKNHGKVFDERNGHIEIWRPVAHLVHQYFGGHQHTVPKQEIRCARCGAVGTIHWETSR